MARHNLVFLLGTLALDPTIQKNENGEIIYASMHLNVARADRDVGDKRKNMQIDCIPILVRDPLILNTMSAWKENDIIEVKGMIAFKTIDKGSYCTFCRTKNTSSGVYVYVYPISAVKRGECVSNDEANRFLKENRENSNMVFCFGNLCTDPKKITTPRGIPATQYQIAINRKFKIRTDPPERKTDYPWVKSYGDNAIEDRKRLMVGSSVFIDGCLQQRNIKRHLKCQNEDCLKTYDWYDEALEIVPYETEYIYKIKTDGQIDEERSKFYAQKENDLFSDDYDIKDDEVTEDDIKNGFDIVDEKI